MDKLSHGGAVDLSYPTSKIRRGRVKQEGHIASTINTSCNSASIIYHISDLRKQDKMFMDSDKIEYKIRRLTPTECFLLMGFQKEDAYRCEQAGMSPSAMYKQAGNGMVTNCVQLIVEHLYKAQYDNGYICTDEDIIKGTPHHAIAPDKRIKMRGNIMFSGIGCQERGINNSGCFAFDVRCTSDIDANAIISYDAIHNKTTDNCSGEVDRRIMIDELLIKNINYDFKNDKPYNWGRYLKPPRDPNKDLLLKTYNAIERTNNLGDISKINELPYADFWSISSPCTNISLAGKLEGLDQNSGTASSLVWDSARLLYKAKQTNTLPKYLFLENVKNLVSKSFKKDFDMILSTFSDLGYNTYWQILNAKDFGIPQHRERVFVIGIRKDIDTGRFEFPKPFDTGIRLEDVLVSPELIDQRFFFSDKVTEQLLHNLVVDGVLDEEECIVAAPNGRYNYYDQNGIYHIYDI